MRGRDSCNGAPSWEGAAGADVAVNLSHAGSIGLWNGSRNRGMVSDSGVFHTPRL